MHPGSWKQHPKCHHQQWAPSTFILVIFPYVFCFFSFRIAMFSIFGNAHCTLKALSNIITNNEHHPLFFPVKFAKAPISIFGSMHWTLKTLPNFVINSEHHCWAHQCTLQPWVIATGAIKMTSSLLELGPLTSLQIRKIYLYHLSFTKYILRPCQHKNIFLRCDSDISGSTHQKYILTAFHWQSIFCVTFQGPCVKNMF